jgi:hypothetical protein
LNGTSLASTPRDVSTIKQTYLRGHGTRSTMVGELPLFT